MLCNTSMGSMDMNEFIETYGFKNEQQFTFTEHSSIADILNQLDIWENHDLTTNLFQTIHLSLLRIRGL